MKEKQKNMANNIEAGQSASRRDGRPIAVDRTRLWLRHRRRKSRLDPRSHILPSVFKPHLVWVRLKLRQQRVARQRQQQHGALPGPFRPSDMQTRGIGISRRCFHPLVIARLNHIRSISIYIYQVGWIGVGWQRLCKTR